MMKMTRFVIGCLLAGSLLAMTACGAEQPDAETTGKSETELTVLDTAVEDNKLAGGKYPALEEFTFERVTVTGTDYPTTRLETYLAENRDALYQQLVGHGITESELVSIGTKKLCMIDLRTGEANLDHAYLPVLKNDHMADAVTLRLEDGKLSVGATFSITWAQKLAEALMRTPQREYLMASCGTDMGNYICLISSENEIVYLIRPEGGEDLPFEEGVDYFSMLYDERLVISYEKVCGRRAVPMVERGIKGVLIYRRSVSAASSGKVLYTFTYIDAEQTVGGQTLETPIDLRDPLSTEGILNQVTTPLGKDIFDSVCADLYREEFYLLPEKIVGVTADGGADEHIVICYEDGTMFTSHGHAARKNNERFKQIYDYVDMCRAAAEAAEAAKEAKPE